MIVELFRRCAGVLVPAFALAFLPSPAQAGAIEQLRQFVEQTRAATGRFEQTALAGTRTTRADNGSGEFAFERPGRFRWSVEKPFRQLLVSDGVNAYFFDHDLNQVTVRPVGEAMGSTPAAILFGMADVDQSFDLTEAGSSEGLDWIDAVPRTRDAGFERIRIGFRGALPHAMEVLDSFGRTLRFRFFDLVRNPVLGPDTFRFAIPEGADVVRQ